jgi:hypothetical protein
MPEPCFCPLKTTGTKKSRKPSIIYIIIIIIIVVIEGLLDHPRLFSVSLFPPYPSNRSKQTLPIGPSLE